MTDEELNKTLIARLRKADEYEPLGHDGWEAADRIEELTKERDQHWDSFVHWRKEADDRSEQLAAARRDAEEAEAYAGEVEAERRKTYEALLKVTRIHDEVEAKLAKAVEGLTLIERAYYQESTNPSPATIRRMAARMNGIARETQDALAELTGGKDE